MNNINLPNDTLKEFCRENHIKKLSLFGSVLNDDFEPGRSDIDILVEFYHGKYPSLFQFAGLEIELSELLAQKVDLKTKEDLSKYFREEVINSAVTIFDSEKDYEYA
ncbi:MAG: nucleotidyltransferase [Bacteroidetes bacterium]|nr:MAG: nucleotidyltransferase [Bacteroidota bacterium]